MKRALRLLLPLAVLAAISWPGCYTVLMHPTDDDGYRASQVSDCTRCHANYNDYPYGHYYSPYPDYWWNYPHYSGYYADPWWWSYYDYPHAGRDAGGGDTDADRGTKFDRREASSPPTPPYVTSGGRTVVRPSELNYQSGGASSLGSGSGTGSSRPKTDSTGTGTTTTDTSGSGGTTEQGKTVRQTQQDRPTPQSESTVKPSDTKTEQPSKEQPKKEEETKKSRRGGGKD